MNRKAFYDHLRGTTLFSSGFSQRQVTAIEALLDEGEHLPLPHLAHVFAEVYHETGAGMYPVKETVMPWHKDKNPSDATVISRLDRAWSKGQLPWVKKPYWRDGAFGRGMIQATWWDNYEKLTPLVGVDLCANPDKALNPAISARMAVKGCEHGTFRNVKLSDFDGHTGYDHFRARNIVNGDTLKVDKGVRMGDRISGYAAVFEQALAAAGYGATPEAQETGSVPPPSAKPVAGVPTLTPKDLRALHAHIAALQEFLDWAKEHLPHPEDVPTEDQEEN